MTLEMEANCRVLRGRLHLGPPSPHPPCPCPPALEKPCLPQPLDCDDVYAQGYQVDGVYLIYPSGPSVPVPVFCDMTTAGGKWTVSGSGEQRPGSGPRRAPRLNLRALQFFHL